MDFKDGSCCVSKKMDVRHYFPLSFDAKGSQWIAGGLGALSIGIPLLAAGYMFGGAVHTPYQTIFQKPKCFINGKVEPGYEQVRDSVFSRLRSLGQSCV
jgi:hypothetical protein